MRRVIRRKKALSCFLVSVGIGLSGIQARQDGDALGEVDTIWPGVRFQLTRVERIPANRLLVVVRLIATRQAPATGTFIGIKAQVPANVPREELFSSKYTPRPFSLASSQMVWDQTGQRYPALPPLASGPQYIPGAILTTLRPGQAEILTVQFAAPTAYADEPKQTVSFLFANAKGPITKVRIPPPEAASDSAAQSR